MIISFYLLFLFDRALFKGIRANNVLRSEDLRSEILVGEVISNLVQPVAIKCDPENISACEVRMCNEDRSICSEFGDFKSREDYSQVESVRKKVCSYKLYDISSFYDFTRQNYDRLVPSEQQSSFPFYNFMLVGWLKNSLYFAKTGIP